ncbi:MAG TPA: HAD-IA family hydrolase [Planctomycetota bacterium]|nr:HAD-IA family hydrolase [Planctomycetota bacterium]
MRYDLVCLDLDGTLVDSGADIAASLNWSLRREGMAELPEPRIIAAIGGGLPTLLDRTIGPDHPKRKEVHAGIIEHYSAHLLDRTTLYPGVRETLERLTVPRVLVTNKPEGMSRKLLAGLGITDLFAAIYGGDTRPARKPDPGAVLESLERFKVAKSAAILVGDSSVDVATARAAGIDCAAVTYGYATAGELEGARYRLDRFADLLPIVTG